MLVVQSMCPYRIEALEDAEVIEIGNKASVYDVVMLEDDFGRVEKDSSVKEI